MLKRLSFVFLGFAITFLGLTSSVTEVFAAKSGKEKYDGKSPVATHCDDSGVAMRKKSFSKSNVSGTVYLMYSTECKTAWAFVKLNKALQKNSQVVAFVQRNNDKKSYNCTHKNGNGRVQPGQTTCYSPMVYDYKPNTSYAYAIVYDTKLQPPVGARLATTSSY